MHKIDTPDATRDGRFTEGDPTVPVPATTVSADWLNAVQDEVLAVLSAAGLAPAKNNNAQLLAALKKIVGTVNALTATRLETARTIEGVSFDGTADIHRYATCSTAAGTAAKTASLAGFKLQTGSALRVKFTNANTATGATLNVDGTGAKPLYYHGKVVPAGLPAAGHTYAVVYTGALYEIIGDLLVLAAGGGLAFDVKGHLYVDTSAFSEEMLRAFLEGIIADGGGLGFDRSGKLYVDANAFSDDLLGSFLKSIRVPIWLRKPMDIYIAKTGSDTLDEGRGLSADKPFATLQAALNYISTTYNLYKYNCIVNIASGDYGRNTITLPSYATTTGTVIITGPDQNNPDAVKIGKVYNNFGSYYTLRDLCIKPENVGSHQSAAYATNGTIDLVNTIMDISETVVSNGSLSAVETEDSGKVRIYATNTLERKNGITIRVGTVATQSLISANGGVIQYTADIHIEGNCTVSNATVLAATGGLVRRTVSSFVNPGRAPIITASGTVTGKRYNAALNGIIRAGGGGPDFFPGSEAGVLTTGGQYA